MTTSTEDLVRWPEEYLPARSAVFAHNEIVIAAPAEQVWAWLIRAELWPTWYSNSADIHLISHAGHDLRNRSRFRWKTFGARLTSKVLEFEPNRRLAWDAHGVGVDAYRTWTLRDLSSETTRPSTSVVTEETQNGWMARIGNRLMPKRLHTMHQLWLEALRTQAESGLPPSPPVRPPEGV